MKRSTEAYEAAVTRLRALEQELPEAFAALDTAAVRMLTDQGVEARPSMSRPVEAAYSAWRASQARPEPARWEGRLAVAEVPV